jgi:hypothetical protein
VFVFLVELSKCCSISFVQDSGNSFLCATTNCSKESKLVFFKPTKCQTTPNSTPPFRLFGSLGSDKLFPKSLTHRYTKTCRTLKTLPNTLKEPLPKKNTPHTTTTTHYFQDYIKTNFINYNIPYRVNAASYILPPGCIDY